MCRSFALEAGIRPLIIGILLAAGSGSRFGQKKQFLDLAGSPVWRRSLNLLFQADVSEVWLVVPREDEAVMVSELKQDPKVHIVPGGATRSESVQAALKAIAEHGSVLHPQDCIVIHDAARPFTDITDVKRVIATARDFGGAILAQVCINTVKRIEQDGRIVKTIPRGELMLAETPQVFWWQWMHDEYLKATRERLAQVTDDASIMELAGKPVRVVPGHQPNLKVTTQSDWEYAEWLAARRWGGE
jgi:2-C-methyl-D-erythritol 4-phosphate cytidylyltransferase